MLCDVYKFDSLKDYIFADTFARYNGKWIFCMQKNRDTWETPGGYIETGETPLEAAKRELFEETGAIAFDMLPLCDYHMHNDEEGRIAELNGMIFFAEVYSLGDLPPSEMEKICLVDSPPERLTYPEYTRAVYPLAVKIAAHLP